MGLRAVDPPTHVACVSRAQNPYSSCPDASPRSHSCGLHLGWPNMPKAVDQPQGLFLDLLPTQRPTLLSTITNPPAQKAATGMSVHTAPQPSATNLHLECTLHRTRPKPKLSAASAQPQLCKGQACISPRISPASVAQARIALVFLWSLAEAGSGRLLQLLPSKQLVSCPKGFRPVSAQSRLVLTHSTQHACLLSGFPLHEAQIYTNSKHKAALRSPQINGQTAKYAHLQPLGTA